MDWDSFFSLGGFVVWLAGFLVVLTMPVMVYFFIMSAIANKVNHRPRKEKPRGFPVKLK